MTKFCRKKYLLVPLVDIKTGLLRIKLYFVCLPKVLGHRNAGAVSLLKIMSIGIDSVGHSINLVRLTVMGSDNSNSFIVNI